MTTAETVVLYGHIAAGVVALLAGFGAFATRKGGRRHRRFGRAYVSAMAVVSGSALALYPFEPGFLRLFLSLVAVFSFYFAFSGYRVLSRKRPADDPGTVDWAAVGLYGTASVGLVGLGAWRYVAGSGFAVVLLVFGGLGTLFTVQDVRTFRRETERGAWVGEHVVRMGAAYIATVSAVSAVNLLVLSPVLRWLWPTLVGVPTLIYLQRRYEARFGVA
jgi:uncharacterized membrane protein